MSVTNEGNERREVAPGQDRGDQELKVTNTGGTGAARLDQALGTSKSRDGRSERGNNGQRDASRREGGKGEQAANGETRDGQTQEDQQREHSTESANGKNQHGQDGQTVAERITWIVSAAIVLGLALVVMYRISQSGSTVPPTVLVRPQTHAVREEFDHYYLPVEVTNLGGVTIEDVAVELTLENSQGQTESASFTIRFLPGDGRTQSIVVFRSDPSQGELTSTFSFAMR